MVASQDSIQQIVRIIRKEIASKQRANRLAARLHREVRGNKSVEETLRLLWEEMRKPIP